MELGCSLLLSFEIRRRPGLPGLAFALAVREQVLSDSERVMRELAAQTDFLVISQGFDDHCHREFF